MAMPDTDRKEVFSSIRAALRAAFNADRPSPVWWIRFRVTGAGSGGSHGGALSILDLLDSGAFTARHAAGIRANRAGPSSQAWKSSSKRNLPSQSDMTHEQHDFIAKH